MGVLLISDELRAKAEVHYGDALGQEKARFLLRELGLPEGLLPLRDILECGFVGETGFIWVLQAQRVEHYFAGGVNRIVAYAPLITAYIDRALGRLTKVKGIYAKELLIWVPLNELSILRKDPEYRHDPASGVLPPPAERLLCKGPMGITRVYPSSAFVCDQNLKQQLQLS